MWTPIIIIALAVAMVVGPVMLMRPSRLQQRQSRLREYAIRQGLRVQLQPAPEGAMSLEDRQMLPVYSLPPADTKASGDRPPPWLLVKRSLAHEIHFSGHWDWSPGRQAASQRWEALRHLLPQLPADVVALGSGPQGTYVFWGEEGNEASIDKLAELLTTARG